jgi:hypothetical protein
MNDGPTVPPWSEAWTEKERAELASRERTAQHAETLRSQRLAATWEGIGWLVGGLAVLAAGVFGFARLVDAAEQHGRDSIQIERAETERVRACVELNEPLERQYCLLAVQGPTEDGE